MVQESGPQLTGLLADFAATHSPSKWFPSQAVQAQPAPGPAPAVSSVGGVPPGRLASASWSPGLPVEPHAGQPYRGRLDSPTIATAWPGARPGTDFETLAPPEPAPRVFPAPPARTAARSETPRRRPLEGDRPSNSDDEASETRLERIVERTLVPAVRPSPQATQAPQAPSVAPAPPVVPDLAPATRPARASSAPAVPAASQAPSAEPVTRFLQPVVPPLPDLAARNPPPQPAPTVNVTIGRIEVRATPPVASQRRPAPRPQIMSLDEYLQSRTNGGRR